MTVERKKRCLVFHRWVREGGWGIFSARTCLRCGKHEPNFGEALRLERQQEAEELLHVLARTAADLHFYGVSGDEMAEIVRKAWRSQLSIEGVK